MTPLLYTVSLFLLTFLVLALSLAPALSEWYGKKDSAPLRVVREQDANIRHFANSFKTQVATFFDEHSIEPSHPPGPLETVWHVNEPVTFLGNTEFPQFKPDEILARLVNRVLIGCGDLLLPGDMVFEKEVYCRGSLRTSDKTAFRALYSEKEIVLGAESVVVRWLHSDDVIHVGPGSQLFGRLSANNRAHIGMGCEFERLSSPTIRFAGEQIGAIKAVRRVSRDPWVPDDGIEAVDTDTLKARSDLTIGDRLIVEKNLIAKRGLSIGAEVEVRGSLKAYRTLRIAQGSIIRGSLVCCGPIEIGDGCLIKGPIISETAISIGIGSVVGTPALCTTVLAPHVKVAPGAQISGSLWAGVAGRVAL